MYRRPSRTSPTFNPCSWRLGLPFCGWLFGIGYVGTSPAAAQANLNAEFRVNAITAESQSYPSVAAHDGGFVVVWDSPGDGQWRGVFARRYDTAGTGGSIFQVNAYTTSYQWRPQVAAASSGGFVVTWESYGQDGSHYGIFARRYDSSGSAWPEFPVNTYTTDRQRFPAVAVAPGGSFVIVWTSVTPGGYQDIFGRAYDRFGSPQTAEFRVNTSTTGFESHPDVAMDGSGGFVVVWGGKDANLDGVFARRFAAGGQGLGDEFQVNTYTTGNQYAPSVAIDGSGNFVVAWIGRDADGQGVSARRYDGFGTPMGDEFQVNSYTTGSQSYRPAVAFDDGGNFVVAWSSYEDGSDLGVFARRFDAGGVAPCGDFRLNSHTTRSQKEPSLAPDGSGRFVAVWMSYEQDGDRWGVFGKRFDPDVIFADGFE